MQDTDPFIITPTRVLVDLTAIDTSESLRSTCDDSDSESPVMVTNEHLELLHSSACLEVKRLYISTIRISTDRCKVNITGPTELSKSMHWTHLLLLFISCMILHNIMHAFVNHTIYIGTHLLQNVSLTLTSQPGEISVSCDFVNVSGLLPSGFMAIAYGSI